MSKLKLPAPIAAYFDADKHDADAITRCFTAQAVVKDEGRTYSGSAAIKAWKKSFRQILVHQSDPPQLGWKLRRLQLNATPFSA